ncbi:MAG: hypothetical protein VB011_05900 [Bacteroidales bacterium]|nr:hypothetical protein [Bacteroidales bacterium]
MNVQFSLVDIIVSIVVLAFYFAIYYFPYDKFYKKLQNPAQVIKQNIMISKFLLILFIVFFIFYYTLTIYSYFDYEKDWGLPYEIKFFPLTVIFFELISIKLSKRALKDLEKDN